MRKFTTCVLALLGVATVLAGPGPDADLIKNLPDCTLNTDSYSGYLTVTDTKKLHYVYVASQDKPVEDPLVIWFNGGPGCSSLEGLFQEHGPCVMLDTETKMKQNPYSWNLRANVLYIENPAGVGFSIAGDDDDWLHSDYSTSLDLIEGLKDFYTKFPTLVNNDLYVSGESYAGIYVPYLTW